jgi:hypothetical protein
VQIIGDGACELIHVGQMALLNDCEVDTFVDNIFNFPTLAEAYRVAALDIAKQRKKLLARRSRAARARRPRPLPPLPRPPPPRAESPSRSRGPCIPGSRSTRVRRSGPVRVGAKAARHGTLCRRRIMVSGTEYLAGASSPLRSRSPASRARCPPRRPSSGSSRRASARRASASATRWPSTAT